MFVNEPPFRFVNIIHGFVFCPETPVSYAVRYFISVSYFSYYLFFLFFFFFLFLPFLPLILSLSYILNYWFHISLFYKKSSLLVI